MTKTEKIEKLEKRLSEVEAENRLLHHSVDYLTKQLYGSKSEKTSTLALSGQVYLFDEAEYFEEEELPQTTLEEAKPRKKKEIGHKEKALKELPHEKRLLSLTEEEQVCGQCNTPLHLVGEEFVRSEVEYHPARLIVVDYYRESFECRNCRKEEQPYMHKPSVPMPVIAHSFASVSLVSRVMQQKYLMAVPLYRQGQEWEALGLSISRATMSNWITASYRDWLVPMLTLLHEILLAQTHLHADETPIQVLQEEGRSNTTDSYMWVYSSGKYEKQPIRFFDYQPGRSGKYPKEFLKGFQGFLHTDAYQGYEQVDGITRCLCWAHLRRYFVDSLPKDGKGAEASLAAEGIRKINKLFAIERQLESLPKEERQRLRLEKESEKLAEFWLWVEETGPTVLEKSKLGKAFSYAQNQKKDLHGYLQDGDCVFSNNLVENSIRPFTIGRKNWLFSGGPKGAHASAGVYTVFETAKANKLDPAKYIQLLLEELPGRYGPLDPQFLRTLLPWCELAQQRCR